jgi:hypothetical protein
MVGKLLMEQRAGAVKKLSQKLEIKYLRMGGIDR